MSCTVAQPKPGYISLDILTDTMEGMPLLFYVDLEAYGWHRMFRGIKYTCNLAPCMLTWCYFSLMLVSKKPIVAAIDGHALGGGLEIAMVGIKLFCCSHESILLIIPLVMSCTDFNSKCKTWIARTAPWYNSWIWRYASFSFTTNMECKCPALVQNIN